MVDMNGFKMETIAAAMEKRFYYSQFKPSDEAGAISSHPAHSKENGRNCGGVSTSSSCASGLGALPL